MASLYKSELGKKEILSLYDEKLKELAIDYSCQMVETSYGKTNIIVTGDASNPPLFIIHGSNACAPIALEVYPNLSKYYQVFAIDVLAQPNKSTDKRLCMKSDAYGKWMGELIKTIGVKEPTLVGFSLGGLVILKTLIHSRVKIKEVFLTAPAFVVNGNPLKAIFRIFIPMQLYIRTEKVKYIEKFLAQLFTERDAFAVKYLSKVFLHFKMDFSPVPVITKKEAALIKTPITLIAAKDDVIFPGEKMLKRAKKIFPSLKKTILLEDSKHVQSKAGNCFIENIILEDEAVK